MTRQQNNTQHNETHDNEAERDNIQHNKALYYETYNNETEHDNTAN
jgi:hypothetical protein